MIAYLYFNLNVEIYHMFIDFIIVVQLHLKKLHYRGNQLHLFLQF